MKKFINFGVSSFVVVLALLFSFPALAFEDDPECLGVEGEFNDCKITLDGETLRIEYEDSKDQNLSAIVPIDRIASASSLNYYAGPGFFEAGGLKLGLIIDYLDDQNQTQMRVIEFNPREGFIFLSLLREQGIAIDWNLRHE